MSNLLPIAPNPVADRANKDPLELLREDIQIGQELVNSPAIVRYLREEYANLSYKINHLQPSTESDRDTAYALNTANAKLNVLEKLYNFALNLQSAMQQHEELTRVEPNDE